MSRQGLFIVIALILSSALIQAQQWQGLVNPPPTEIGAILLLTDGTVIGHEEPDTVETLATVNWYKLTPDINGSYVNGTWSQIAPLPTDYCPLYFGSAVLPDGRVIVEGGEGNLCSKGTFTNQGAIYDPAANTWTPVNPPNGWIYISDAASAVLADGTYMQAAWISPDALLDAATLTWTITGTAGKFDINEEEGWTLLPSGKVLTVDTYHRIPFVGTNSEVYDPNTGVWSSAGGTISLLWDNCYSDAYRLVPHETGPAVLQPTGKVFAMGGNGCGAGQTAIYDTVAQTWTPGPPFPNSLNMDDGPAALEINGNVLMMASPGLFNPPATFLEWDGRQLNPVDGPPNAPVDTSYQGHMLMLPTGQILFTDFSNNVQIFTSAGSPYTGWDPQVVLPTSHPAFTRGTTVLLQGYNFNGASQNNSYGDDFQDATNYPIVRFTNVSTGHVFYARTHDHSTMAVGYHGPTSTHVDIPENMESGDANMQVIVNGIASRSYPVVIQ
jgi:hypothetical protein